MSRDKLLIEVFGLSGSLSKTMKSSRLTSADASAPNSTPMYSPELVPGARNDVRCSIAPILTVAFGTGNRDLRIRSAK